MWYSLASESYRGLGSRSVKYKRFFGTLMVWSRVEEVSNRSAAGRRRSACLRTMGELRIESQEGLFFGFTLTKDAMTTLRS